MWVEKEEVTMGMALLPAVPRQGISPTSLLRPLPPFFAAALPLALNRIPFSSIPRHISRSRQRSSFSIAAASPSSSSSSRSPFPQLLEGDSDPPRRLWKPLCLYHTQSKCALMNDPVHLQKFNHDILLDLQFNELKLDRMCSDNLDTLLVLDLEGKTEIIEFPVLMMDAKTSNCTDFFHRFVRPVRMGEHQINEYIQGKYGPMGVHRVWHDTAIPFNEVLHEFEAWLTSHHLLNKTNGALHRAAFVTCGNWDVKTKIPQQCKDSKVKLSAYFMEWINLKDIYLNFYNTRATGMRTMLQQLGIPLLGSHHLGIDDTKNIAKVLQRMILDGCSLEITARRKSIAAGSVEFLFENRIDGGGYSRQRHRR